MPTRLLSLPSTLAHLEPLHQLRGGPLEGLRCKLQAQGLTVLPGVCPHCGGLVTEETATVTHPGQDPSRIAMTVWRCHHHFHQNSPTCRPRTAVADAAIGAAEADKPGKETPKTVPTRTAPNTTECAHCGRPAGPHATYCSGSCRTLAYRARRAQQPEEDHDHETDP